MSNETLRVTGSVYGRVGFYEQHLDHPDGQAFVVGGEISEVSLTAGARKALHEGRIKRVGDQEAADTFTPLQIAQQKVANLPTNTPAWYMAMADMQFLKGNRDLGLVLRGRAGINPDVPMDDVLTSLYQNLAGLSPDHGEYRYIVERILEHEAKIGAVADAVEANPAANETESKPDDQAGDQGQAVGDEAPTSNTEDDGEAPAAEEAQSEAPATPKKPKKAATKAD